MTNLRLTRKQLAAFLKDDMDAIRRFEDLFTTVAPISADGSWELIIVAASADVKAQQALDEIQGLSQHLEILLSRFNDLEFEPNETDPTRQEADASQSAQPSHMAGGMSELDDVYAPAPADGSILHFVGAETRYRATRSPSFDTAKTVPVAVVALPGAAAAGSGTRAAVNDANTTLALGIGSAVVGGGANTVPVFSDGASWIIG